MQIKKNPKFDLNRNSSPYFVIALTLVLFITWRALEYKTYEKEKFVVEATRIVAAIPRMTPGMQRGRPVKVPYSIPITFKLQ